MYCSERCVRDCKIASSSLNRNSSFICWISSSIAAMLELTSAICLRHFSSSSTDVRFCEVPFPLAPLFKSAQTQTHSNLQQAPESDTQCNASSHRCGNGKGSKPPRFLLLHHDLVGNSYGTIAVMEHGRSRGALSSSHGLGNLFVCQPLLLQKANLFRFRRSYHLIEWSKFRPSESHLQHSNVRFVTIPP